MEQLSVAIITRNEERNLERCLNALQGVADEIVVVDSYSTDGTVDICRRYGCKVTLREFQGFGSQRQYAVGLTTHKYVLCIDAAEVIDETLRRHIMALKETGFEHREYKITIQNYFCGEPLSHSGYEPGECVRLFNKRYANWDLRDVSDKVSYPDGVMAESMPGAIHHYRCSTLDEFFRKENRIASLEAGILAARERSISALTPRLMAAWQYVKSHVVHYAWMDGSRGFTIARRRAKTTYEAYRMARHLISEK